MKADVLQLRPTQFALGMLEVEHKVTHLKKLEKKEMEEYLEEHPVPVVLSPSGDLYLVDHHHLVRACWELGITQVKTEKFADLSKLNASDFWKKMKDSQWLYLLDQFGKGPHDPTLLPFDVRGLADDPFRSLAWALREKNIFKKDAHPFSEFSWAEFLRQRIDFHPVKEGFEKTVKKAIELSQLPEAKDLPGYRI